MSIKSDVTICLWDEIKRLPTRFNEVSIHLRKISSVFEDEMTNGNQYCDLHLLELFLKLIESIENYHDYREWGGNGGQSSNPERDEKLMEKWKKIKNIRTFPKGISTYPNGEERKSIDYGLSYKSNEISRIMKIWELLHDEWWDGDSSTEKEIEEYMNPKVEKGSSNQVEGVMV